MSEAVAMQPAPSRPDMVGYVEAVTDEAALGWTWRPGSPARMTVELRLEAQAVSRATADGLREDLAQSGIGDGRHAFKLPIPEALRARAAELRVVVIADDGAELLLSAPPAQAAAAGSSTAGLQRGIEALIGSQRVMHRNLQAALLQQPSVASALAEIATVQAGLRESLATFELFAVRLEQALAQRDGPARSTNMSGGLAIVAGIAGLALIGSCCALWRSVTG